MILAGFWNVCEPGKWRLTMIDAKNIPLPESLEELDALCDRWRSAMKASFDFEIGPKKQNKLRDAVSHFMGFPNGLQQLQATFPEDLSKTTAYPEAWPEVIILEEIMDEIFLYLDAEDMTVDRQGQIEELLPQPGCAGSRSLFFSDDGNPGDQDDILEVLGTSFEEADRALKAHYVVDRVLAIVPDINKYGCSDIAIPGRAADTIRSEYGLRCKPGIEDDHLTIPEGDTSGSVCLKLVKRPKTNR